ncbi:MAG: aspartate carbamoyltransferase regulatory subunit [Clostridia bacterium]|nr:aspartate carbamoyltransferase regulatory subunit [Clostridia bacterium]
MTIDSIVNGIVIDHIAQGKAMEIYSYLSLDKIDSQVAIIKNAPSKKIGKKDIIKIDGEFALNLDIIGFIDPESTVNIIRDGKLVEKKKLQLPEKLTDVLKCKNPRCITTTEQDIKHIFLLKNSEKREYRCLYCESRAE